MAGGVIHVDWYATVLRQESFAAEVAAVAPLALRYGATQYSVHRSLDDRYKITQMTWVDSHAAWYRFWDGAEMVEFRRRFAGHYQIPIAYVWYEELTSGALAPEPWDEVVPGATPPAAA
jgi:hypothetical protein